MNNAYQKAFAGIRMFGSIREATVATSGKSGNQSGTRLAHPPNRPLEPPSKSEVKFDSKVPIPDGGLSLSIVQAILTSSSNLQPLFLRLPSLFCHVWAPRQFEPQAPITQGLARDVSKKSH